MEQLELGVRAALDADDETRLREAVAQARASQLSWAQCAQAFARAGRRVSRQAVAARFG